MKKNILFLFLFITVSFSVSVYAQRNRYGVKLAEKNGVYRIAGEKKFEKLYKGDFSKLPADYYTLYKGYEHNLINDEDYLNCITKKYVFKEYPQKNYVLNIEIDIPKVKLEDGRLYPFIIWVHGGGWVAGDIDGFKNQSQYLASRGIAGVRIDYSLTKQGGHFEQGMKEIEESLQFVKKHCNELGIDTCMFGFAGGSAGTPLASLAAMKYSKDGCCLYIGGNGIYDFESNRDGKFCGGNLSKNKYLENIKDFKSISAISNIPEKKNQVPSVILFHGTADITISCKQSIAFGNAIKDKGGISEVHVYKYYTHAFFNKNSSDAYEDVILKMYDFAQKIFKMPVKK